MVTFATWNVNSVNKRLPNLLAWLDSFSPDVLMLQELKTVEEKFPFLEIQERGYHVEVLGQKSYNGVALLSKAPLENVIKGLPGYESDEQARYIEATTFGIRVGGLYLPNGNPLGTEKFPYKLEWMDHLISHARALLKTEQPVLLGGDYNLIPTDDDVYNPKLFEKDALTQPESRARFRTLLNLGYTEAWRSLHRESHVYSYWDYTKRAYEHDNGIRIDHLLLSPQAADLLVKCEIDKAPRGEESPSDHTPVWCELSVDPAEQE
ncbi:exodeoxyribonuclease III [Kiloniella sp. b19]|uniref:exodeoxyribonuclease III n=1 Tax=Kiloniella sp. GXU_MW_B19 TaxID=3141326 RepID=UPI0031D3BE0C